ncbi:MULTISPECIES: hypothetical protein [unclassified Methanosarcina]|uniref:hypothetical protein n=1 Tax=unclassified Methanosarcina TaxID=2644672 RepID=UPI0012E009EC|nr:MULTISPECIES: hypothetical protein [unclassified Methanosarcina]
MISWFPSQVKAIPNVLPIIRMLPEIIFVAVYLMTISILFYTYFKWKHMPIHVLKYSHIKGVTIVSDFFDYYYTLIPVCLITTGIALVTLVNVHVYFVLAGIILFCLGWYALFMFTLMKITFYKMGVYDKYNNITRANDILINYISPNDTDIRYLAIKEFTKHFKKVLDGIDFHFSALYNKRMNIDSLQTEENITVKQLIIRYLPLYLSYCSETELNSFKTKLNSMANLIDNENTITSLDIIKIIHSIHQDIVTFLNQHSYVIPKNNLFTNFIYNINKKQTYLMEVFVGIFFIIGLFKFFIPDEVLNNLLNETFDHILGYRVDFALMPLLFCQYLLFISF